MPIAQRAARLGIFFCLPYMWCLIVCGQLKALLARFFGHVGQKGLRIDWLIVFMVMLLPLRHVSKWLFCFKAAHISFLKMLCRGRFIWPAVVCPTEKEKAYQSIGKTKGATTFAIIIRRQGLQPIYTSSLFPIPLKTSCLVRGQPLFMYPHGIIPDF